MRHCPSRCASASLAPVSDLSLNFVFPPASFAESRIQAVLLALRSRLINWSDAVAKSPLSDYPQEPTERLTETTRRTNCSRGTTQPRKKTTSPPMPGIRVLRVNEQVPELSYRVSPDSASATPPSTINIEICVCDVTMNVGT